MSAKGLMSARAAGMVLCTKCHLLVKQDSLLHDRRCPRCDSRLCMRKPHSLTRTWALVITSFILLFPANLLPIMTLTYLGDKEPNTILQGIQAFIKSGTYFIALVIFIASILVPVFKVVLIMLILVSIRRNWNRNQRQRAWMFRTIKFIGRWSMLDIFVLALLVALVEFGALTTIQAGPAATFFAGVVVFTMLAANTFDPRLIWEENGYDR